MLAAAIAEELYGQGYSQTWLGAEVAALEGRREPYAQAAVSRWLDGQTALEPERVFLIERALGKRPGTFSRLAGYVPAGSRPVRSVIDALEADPALSPEGRRTVAIAYRAAVEASRGD